MADIAAQIEIDEETHAWLEKVAAENGWTIEEAGREAILEGYRVYER